MRESEKWKWSRSVVSDSQWPHGLQPTRLLCPWDSPGKSTGVGCLCLLHESTDDPSKVFFISILMSSISFWYFLRVSISVYITHLFFHVSHSVVSNSLRTHELQHSRPPCPSPTPGVHSNSCPSSRWYHPAISSSVIPFSSCPQYLLASESFPMSQLFTWVESIGVSALASFFPKNTQDWSPLEWTGWISLQSKGLSRVFSNTTVQKHQFFGTQLSS